jgi:alpha-glucosidase
LAGLLSRVDYLKWLGVDAVWLTPIYRSPFRDLGYDISDYCSIDSAFGTLDDFDLLLGRLHDAGIRLILDLVPNHTANDHAWFVESRSSRDNAKADWYIWADPAENGGPPNNWLSRFGGSAWEWCEARRQYYYHSFLVEQPGTSEVRAAIADVMRFWLDRGVDGFRVDCQRRPDQGPPAARQSAQSGCRGRTAAAAPDACFYRRSSGDDAMHRGHPERDRPISWKAVVRRSAR